MHFVELRTFKACTKLEMVLKNGPRGGVLAEPHQSSVCTSVRIDLMVHFALV